MYGSYLKFLKTHQKTKKKDWNEQEILINCSVSSMRTELLRQAFIIPSVERGVCIRGRLIKIKLIAYYKSYYFAFSHEGVVSGTGDKRERNSIRSTAAAAVVAACIVYGLNCVHSFVCKLEWAIN